MAENITPGQRVVKKRHQILFKYGAQSQNFREKIGAYIIWI